MTTPVRFMYIRGTGRDLGRVVTVAREVVGDSIHVGWACCNAVDQHNKARARQIAQGRLRVCPVVVPLNGKTPREVDVPELAMRAMIAADMAQSVTRVLRQELLAPTNRSLPHPPPSLEDDRGSYQESGF